MSNQVRIIAGHWRGRKLTFPDQEGLRPSPDRVRETLFNWLQGEIVGARCLDLFAGSGALGIEAASRGAASVTCVEKNPQVAACLEKNIAALNTGQIRVINQDALAFLQQNPGAAPYDLVFLDPPFTSGVMETCCALLEQYQRLSPAAAIYLESGSPLEELELPTNWALLKNKKAGQVFYGLCRRQD